MLMYNLLEYSQNYYMASGLLWNYYRDKIDNINDNASDGRSFKYKTKIIANADDFNSFKYKAKLLENSEAQPAPIMLMEFKISSNCCTIKIFK